MPGPKGGPERARRRRVRLLLVGDDPLARGGLAALLGAEPELTLVGEAAAEDGLRDAVAAAEPDAVLWDLGPPSAFSGSLERAAELGGCPFVALVSDPDLVPDALAAGASGVLPRDAAAPSVAAALAAAARRLVVLDPLLAEPLLRPRPPARAELVEDLTPREREVLDLLAQGLTNKAIAQRLGVSDHTAKFHVNSILGKLGAGTRTEALVLAARLGLIAL
jgi:DNA-binding NarL/FixJ family response regulator